MWKYQGGEGHLGMKKLTSKNIIYILVGALIGGAIGAVIGYYGFYLFWWLLGIGRAFFGNTMAAVSANKDFLGGQQMFTVGGALIVGALGVFAAYPSEK
jgi:hypothetical protein